MDSLGLSLRQKKLLHLLRGHNDFITGSSLAKQLGVSARTIRSDVAGINDVLAPYKAKIYSEHSKGYRYIAEDPDAIQTMNQIDIAFLTRDERVRYLAFRFCLADEPVDIYELEDEIFVSHTTLEHDLRQLKMTYVLAGPRIRLIQEKSRISFEQDEQKRRFILNHLFHADWDYHGRSNAYYTYLFLEKESMDTILSILPDILFRNHIAMEDPNLVALNLAIAIMIHRVTSGHALKEKTCAGLKDADIVRAVEELFAVLTEEYGQIFPQEEKEEIGRLITISRLPDMSAISRDNYEEHFDPETLRLAEEYIERIRDIYQLDLKADTDFVVTLLFFLNYLKTEDHIFNKVESRDIAREMLLPEYEIAWCMQDLAMEHLGYYITETEILNLAEIIGGALEFYAETHPEFKLRTVICCHMNMPAAWALKRKVLAAFDKYLKVIALLPVNAKDVRGFSDADLILTTVRKKLTDRTDVKVIRIGAFLPSQDYWKISEYIRDYRIERLYPLNDELTGNLWKNAYKHDQVSVSGRFEVIEMMAEEFIRDGVVPAEFESDILRRESLSSFEIRPGVLFLHSLIPATETRLSIAVFEHQIMWKSHKIRVAVMGAFRREDTGCLLRLNQFLNAQVDPEEVRGLKTCEEVVGYFGKTGDGSLS